MRSWGMQGELGVRHAATHQLSRLIYSSKNNLLVLRDNLKTLQTKASDPKLHP